MCFCALATARSRKWCAGICRDKRNSQHTPLKRALPDPTAPSSRSCCVSLRSADYVALCTAVIGCAAMCSRFRSVSVRLSLVHKQPEHFISRCIHTAEFAWNATLRTGYVGYWRISFRSACGYHLEISSSARLAEITTFGSLPFLYPLL